MIDSESSVKARESRDQRYNRIKGQAPNLSDDEVLTAICGEYENELDAFRAQSRTPVGEDVVDAMARASLNAYFASLGAQPFDQYSVDTREALLVQERPRIRAALAAMPPPPPEDPTPAMLDRAISTAQTTRLYLTERQAHDIWQAMIDEWMAGR